MTKNIKKEINSVSCTPCIPFFERLHSTGGTPVFFRYNELKGREAMWQEKTRNKKQKNLRGLQQPPS